MFGLEEKAFQVLTDKYVSVQKLAALLESLFGQQWEIKFTNDICRIRSPRPLTQDEIKSCKARSGSRNPHPEQHEVSAASPPLLKSPKYSALDENVAPESSTGGGITLTKASGGSLSPSKIPISGKTSFPSKSSKAPKTSSAQSERHEALRAIRKPLKSPEVSSESSLLRRPDPLKNYFPLSKIPKALKKIPSSLKSFNHPEADRRPTIQSSAQGDITLTIGDKEFGAVKAPDSVLLVKNWRGYNTDENGEPGRGYELISQGHTSIVFKIDAMMTQSTEGTKRSEESTVIKLAVKRLKKGIPPIQFEEEYRNLNTVSRARHPNIVTFLSAFLYEEDNTISHNFLFPVAIGNLKQLFSGSINHSTLLQCLNTLWAQFEGLASALQFLHDRCHMVHRDIKPSNILIYEHADGKRLVTKFADFGLAKDCMEDNRDFGELLRYQDVWKLGTVFAELLTFLLGGTKGVKQFRAFITVTYDQITSDTFEDIRYDENKVKAEVIEWLKRTLRRHARGKEVAEITMRMLGTKDESSSAANVAEYLIHSSNASFFDGSRFVSFSNAGSIPGPSMFDKARSFVEKKIGAPVYWWPLPSVQYPCPIGSTRIEWKWCTHDLYVDLPTEVVKVYREKCCKIASSLQPGPLLPLSNPQPTSFVSGSSQPTGSNTVAQLHQTNNGPQPSGTNSGAITTALALQSSRQVQVRELYWCVDKAWIEPSETWLCIEDPHQILEDRILCLRLKDLYDRVRGLRGRYLSWKTCLGVKFTSFNRLYTGKDQVICMSVGLPKPPEYEYTLFQPELVHMAIASSQILAGIHDPSKVEGNNTLEMIPKKVDALLKPDRGAEGWGLHAVQGWSLWKIVSWIGAFTVVGLLFVVLWLVLVDPKDLQNAFTPAAFLVAMLCLALGIPQFLDAA